MKPSLFASTVCRWVVLLVSAYDGLGSGIEFASTKVQILTPEGMQVVSSLSVRVMDWDLASRNDVVGEVVVPGTHFTGFTGTKVQILTPEELRRMMWLANKVAACYTVYLLH